MVKKPYPNYSTKFVTTHKNAVRAAKFSHDGKLLATGSLDTSLKLLDVDKMKTYNLHKGEGDEFAKPVIRTFYDHTGVIFFCLIRLITRRLMIWISILLLQF